MSKKLTEKQKLFCKYYLISLNATDAAIKAGYSKKTATKQGSQLLDKTRHPLIAEYIEKNFKKKEDELDISVDRVLKELAAIAFLDINDFYTEGGILKTPSQINETARRAIAGITTKEERIKVGDDEEVYDVKTVKTNDKLKALELLGKYHAMFTEKLELSMDEQVADWLRNK